MPNETIEKFGYPQNVLAEYAHWTVLLRKVQSTAGCVILACSDEAQALPAVSPEAWAEFGGVTADVEGALRSAFAFDKINYLLLMMVDKHVHFHVLPRYAASRRFEGVEFKDPGWPRAPALTEATEISEEVFGKLLAHLKERWPARR